MGMVKKYKLLSALFLVVITGIIFFFYKMYQRDIAILENFLVSYKKSEKAISDFSIPVFATDSSRLDQSNKIYSRVTGSMKNMHSNEDRQEMVREAISQNTYLLDSLNETGDLENKAADAISELRSSAIALSRVSSLIKNDKELKGRGIEIADLSRKELNSLSAYKRVFRDKIDAVNKLLKNVVQHNKEQNRVINSLSQYPDLERLSKEFGDLNNNRKAAYARFEELGK